MYVFVYVSVGRVSHLTQSSLNSELTDSAMPWGIPSRILELQADHYAYPAFSMGTSNLNSSSHAYRVKHFIQWTFSPALIFLIK